MVKIFSSILNKIEMLRPRVVAIDGMAASGKSTLADLIAKRFDANVIHMDDFFLPPERKTSERLSEPGGNVDYERFTEEIYRGDLWSLVNRSFTYQKYDCKTGKLFPERITLKPLTVTEGAYCLHPLLRDMFDFKIFLYIPAEVQSRRILERNGADMLKRFQNEWIPLENAYFNELNIKQLCDIAVDTSELF